MIKSNIFKKSCVAFSLFSYLVSSTFAAIPSMSIEYDAAGNVSKQTAGNGQAHNYGYDLAGNVISYSSPGVGSTSFEYGAESLSKFTDFKGLNTTYQTDKLTGQVESITSPDTGTTSFTYDQAGNVTSALTPAGITFNFTYDALNRPVSASFGDESISYSYYSYGSAKGELASIQDSSGSTGFNYNVQGLPLSKTQTTTGAGGGAGASLGYLKTWSAGQLSTLRYPSGKTISYTYDAERITSISLNGAVIVSNITYSANGAPISWQMGSTGTYSRAYDSYGRIVSYSIDGVAKAVAWDENNRVSSIDYSTGTSSFGYDAADRLTSASGGPHAGAGYAYDANGNKTSIAVGGANYGATVDPNSNKILTFTAPGVARSYSYDNKGNTIGDGTRTYSWSNTNRLVSATNGNTTAYYSYNGFGQRVKKVVGQAARYYFYDDDGYSLLGEYFQTTPGSPVAPYMKQCILKVFL